MTSNKTPEEVRGLVEEARDQAEWNLLNAGRPATAGTLSRCAQALTALLDRVAALETEVLKAAFSDRVDKSGSPLTWKEIAETAEAASVTGDYPKVRDLLMGLSLPGDGIHFFEKNCAPLARELKALLLRAETAERALAEEKDGWTRVGYLEGRLEYETEALNFYRDAALRTRFLLAVALACNQTAEREREALRAIAAPLVRVATEVLTPGSPDYVDWLETSKDWMTVFSFGGHSITLGDLRRALSTPVSVQGDLAACTVSAGIEDDSPDSRTPLEGEQ